MSHYALLVTAPVHSSGHYHAYQFTKALLEQKHHIEVIFFYQSAVGVADSFRLFEKEAWHAQQDWQALAEGHQLSTTVCVTSALRAGMLSEEEAQQQGLESGNIARGFKIAGLGRWMEAALTVDKVVHFK